MYTCKKCGHSSANAIKVCKKCGAELEKPKSGLGFHPTQIFKDWDAEAWLYILAGLLIAAIVVILVVWVF